MSAPDPGRWIVIPRWEEFQHYSKRNPPWIKTYTRLLHDDAYAGLTFHQRGVLHGLWLLYARNDRQIRDNTLTLTRQLGHRVMRRDLDALNHAGFILFRASSVLAQRQRAETETETEEQEQNPNPKQSRLQPNEPAPTARHSNNTETDLQPLAEHINKYLDDLEVPI